MDGSDILIADFCRLVKQARLDKGITVEKAAEDLDLSHGYLTKIENNSNVNPSLKVSLRILNYYGLKIS